MDTGEWISNGLDTNFILNIRKKRKKTKWLNVRKRSSNEIAHKPHIGYGRKREKKRNSWIREKEAATRLGASLILNMGGKEKKWNSWMREKEAATRLRANLILDMGGKEKKWNSWMWEKESATRLRASLILNMAGKEKKWNSWMREKESAKWLTHFSLYMKQTRRMRLRYKKFSIDSIDSTMVLFLEDDIVMKRLFG